MADAEKPFDVHPVVEQLMEQTKVTSPPGKTNLRDQFVAWGSSLCLVLFSMLSTIIHLVSQLLESVADYVIPYLQQVPRQDRPVWLAALTFLIMGLVILNKRRTAGPNYVPPHAGTLPVQTPSVPSIPAPQGQPLPPGVPVDTSKSAF